MVFADHNEVHFPPAFGCAEMTHAGPGGLGGHPHPERDERFEQLSEQRSVTRDGRSASLTIQQGIGVDAEQSGCRTVWPASGTSRSCPRRSATTAWAARLSR